MANYIPCRSPLRPRYSYCTCAYYTDMSRRAERSSRSTPDDRTVPRRGLPQTSRKSSACVSGAHTKGESPTSTGLDGASTNSVPRRTRRLGTFCRSSPMTPDGGFQHLNRVKPSPPPARATARLRVDHSVIESRRPRAEHNPRESLAVPRALGAIMGCVPAESGTGPLVRATGQINCSGMGLMTTRLNNRPESCCSAS